MDDIQTGAICRVSRLATRWVVLFVVVFATCAQAEQDHLPTKAKTFIFGFLPAFSTEKLVATFEPMVDYVAYTADIPLRLETAPSFEEFVRRTHEGHRYDFLFTAPHLYYVAREKAGYKAMVRVKGNPFHATIIVLRDSSIETAAQLSGKQIATVDPLSLVTVLARASLEQAGLIPGNRLHLVITPNHDASLQALLRMRTDAAVVPDPFLTKRLHPEIRSKLRVVMETQQVPHMPVSVAPWVPPEVAERVRAALMTMSGTADGAMVLRKIGYRGFTECLPAEYDELAPLMNFVEL